jgi:hypothetical protein
MMITVLPIMVADLNCASQSSMAATLSILTTARTTSLGFEIAPGDGGTTREGDWPPAMCDRHFVDHSVPTHPAAAPA